MKPHIKQPLHWLFGCLMLAMTTGGVQAEQSIPPLDVFVYMDNSETVYTAQPGSDQTPASQLVGMLDTMFRQPLPEFGKPAFVGPGDRLYIKTFDAKVNDFESAIDVQEPDSWQQPFEQLRTGSHRQSAKLQSALKKTDLAKLFSAIASNNALTVEDGRQKVVLIASDFINDPRNSSDDICAEGTRLQGGQNASTYQPVEAFAKTMADAGTDGRPIYLGFLEVQATASGTSNYANCLRGLLPLRPVTRQLESQVAAGAITGDVIKFTPDQGNPREFARRLMDNIVSATLPPAVIESVELKLGTQPQTVELRLSNQGLKSLNVVGVDYYTGEGPDADRLHQADLGTPVVIGRGETRPVPAPAPVSVVERAQSGQPVFVSIRDSSPGTGERIRRKQVPVTDSSVIQIVEARTSENRSALLIKVQVTRGAPKTPKSMVIQLQDGSQFGEFSLPDLPGGPLKVGEPVRELNPHELNGRIASLPWWQNEIKVAIRDDKDNLSDFVPIDYPLVENGPSITAAKWTEVPGQPGAWQLEFVITNPDGNPQVPVRGTVLMAAESGSILHSCELQAKDMEPGLSTVLSQCVESPSFTPVEGIGNSLLTPPVIKVELDHDTDNVIDLTNAIDVPRPTINRLVIDALGTEITERDGRAVLNIRVRNPSRSNNRVKAVKIIGSGGERVYNSEVRDRETWIGPKQSHAVYLVYDADGVSDFVPRGLPFSVQVMNLADQYSEPARIENPAAEPLKVIEADSSWSPDRAQLQLKVRNENGFEQKATNFAIYATRDGQAPVEILRPVEPVSVPKYETADTLLDFSAAENVVPLFHQYPEPFYICASVSGSSGCPEKYRTRLPQPERKGGISVSPRKKGEKFVDGQYLYLEMKNEDPYPVTVDRLRLRDPISEREVTAALSAPIEFASKEQKRSQRVSFQNPAVWDAFNPDRVQLGANDFPLGGVLSFEPVSITIKGRRFQRSPSDDASGNPRYLVRVDMEVTNKARNRQEATKIDVWVLHGGSPIGIPEKRILVTDPEQTHTERTLYFEVEDWRDNGQNPLYAQARIQRSQQPAVSVEIKRAFNFYYWGWMLSWIMFPGLMMYIISIHRRRLFYFWYRLSSGDGSTGMLGRMRKIADVWNSSMAFHGIPIFGLIPLSIAAFQRWLDVDPTAFGMEYAITDFIILPPLMAMVFAGITFLLHWRRHQDNQLTRQKISGKQNRMPISRMYPNRRWIIWVWWVLIGTIVGVAMYVFVLAPLNLSIYEWLNPINWFYGEVTPYSEITSNTTPAADEGAQQ